MISTTTWTTTISEFYEDDGSKEPGSKEPDSKEPDSKEPDPKGPKGPIDDDIQVALAWKQALGIISLILLSAFIISLICLILRSANCWSSLRKRQLQDRSGRILFGLFVTGLVCSTISSIVFVYCIFAIDSVGYDPLADGMVTCMFAYRFGKMCMGLFFILRLHFVFCDSMLRTPLWQVVTLIVLVVLGSGALLTTSITGPKKLLQFDRETEQNPNLVISTISLGVLILCDIVVLGLYVQRLMSVVIMQGEVSYVRSDDASAASSTHDDTQGEVNPRVEVALDPKMLRTITRSTVLSVFGILSSFWLHLEMIVRLSSGANDGVMYRAVGTVDGTINVFCMYLVFGFSSQYYNLVCRVCHNGMSKCCFCVAEKAIIAKTGSTNPSTVEL